MRCVRSRDRHSHTITHQRIRRLDSLQSRRNLDHQPLRVLPRQRDAVFPHFVAILSPRLHLELLHRIKLERVPRQRTQRLDATLHPIPLENRRIRRHAGKHTRRQPRVVRIRVGAVQKQPQRASVIILRHLHRALRLNKGYDSLDRRRRRRRRRHRRHGRVGAARGRRLGSIRSSLHASSSTRRRPRTPRASPERARRRKTRRGRSRRRHPRRHRARSTSSSSVRNASRTSGVTRRRRPKE